MQPYKEINYSLPLGDRASIRRALIQTFLDEESGTGTGNNASRYRYNVEFFNNYTIYLKRQTQLNKGFDFTVNVEGLYFKKNRKYSSPSHNDIINALLDCKSNFPLEYDYIAKIINDIYNCRWQCSRISGAYFHDFEGNEHPIEIILLALKWLFIEQDCAYWNYSGRMTLFNELVNRELVY